mmetsp:Transcript_18466/g.45330  ORF Transcript_18466/g.45330 Transcript_18466/m.45330 type:complete len:240 (-) Transcript_18466:181-900(-)|eukprot:CAMPEP_0114507724 /NCGR_PEP_ID=MMETSP0109-20121206/12174_1 /TAXON_ID=29199 /ORGANISM="Chlorarachnion reptans, Strain CCCM449" /LENGTH=239 /DNA_ID=CAMNT_0001686519 /DNA_START=71 /DNA_END=790 /DNA_ORIENTATION=-
MTTSPGLSIIPGNYPSLVILLLILKDTLAMNSVRTTSHHPELDDWSGRVAVACPELKTLKTLWVFGYGSLMWKTGFAFEEMKRCYVKGYKRRFWQASTDHRGTPKFPGRVVTLVPDEKCTTWGCAFRVANKDRDYVIRYLDEREKGGYSQTVETAYGMDDEEVARVLFYVGTKENKAYVHEPSDEDTAYIIARAVGPSGANVDYLMHLFNFMSKKEIEDPHVTKLVALVKKQQTELKDS